MMLTFYFLHIASQNIVDWNSEIVPFTFLLLFFICLTNVVCTPTNMNVK